MQHSENSQMTTHRGEDYEDYRISVVPQILLPTHSVTSHLVSSI